MYGTSKKSGNASTPHGKGGGMNGGKGGGKGGAKSGGKKTKMKGKGC